MNDAGDQEEQGEVAGIVDGIEDATDEVSAGDAHQQAAAIGQAEEDAAPPRNGITLPIIVNQAGVTMPPPKAAWRCR